MSQVANALRVLTTVEQSAPPAPTVGGKTCFRPTRCGSDRIPGMTVVHTYYSMPRKSLMRKDQQSLSSS